MIYLAILSNLNLFDFGRNRGVNGIVRNHLVEDDTKIGYEFKAGHRVGVKEL